jgi:hypothetical protein
VRIRYEDFVSDPRITLGRIGECCGLNLNSVADDVLAGRSIPVGHTIAGNRLRMAGSVRLKPDWEWLEKLSAADRSLCWRIAGSLLKHYGYERDGCPPTATRREFNSLERKAG